jgi:signal transduction histidine kinase
LSSVNFITGQQSADDAVAGYASAKHWAIIIIVIACMAGTLLTLGITRNVVSQLGQDPLYLHELALDIAAGKLDRELKPVESPGSVYEVFSFMASNLRRKEAEVERKSAELSAKNEELEQIFYVASHDLRSPLVNIDGYGKELGYSINELYAALDRLSLPEDSLKEIKPLLDDDIPESLRFIQTSATKMDALLAGLLKISRSGRAALRIEDLDMNQLISKVIDSTEFKIKQNEVAVLAGDLPPCRGDVVQMGQVFTNLLDNALKYLDPQRPGVIRITGEQEQGRVVYCIEDNGIGIDPAHQNVIFELFHRLDPSRCLGEGLGLTIVKRILSRLGGDIWVRSAEGTGSRFYVALPGADTAQGPDEEGGI